MALISVLFVPVYIHFIGIEAYGLLGIFVTLQTMASLLDFGFTTTMNREMARFSAQPETSGEARNLVRSLEVIYWSMAILIGAMVIAIAPLLTDHWITTVGLARDTVLTALILIGLIIMLQWPFSFYAGGLMGLQKQVLLGGVNVGLATLRGVGAILILWLVSPTIQAFLGWQLLLSALSTIIVTLLLWHSLPRAAQRPKFQVAQLRRVGRFSAGVAAVGIVGMALLQTDKIVLSRVLTLENFGYYTLAGVVAASLYMLINPIYNAIFPRMAQLVTANSQAMLIAFYHKSAEVMSVVVISAALVLAVFSQQVMYVWTGNPVTVANTYMIVTLLAIGTGLYALQFIPWAAQLAHGWTRLGFTVNLVSLFLVIPLIVFLANRYGAVGGAAAWALMNFGYVLTVPFLMHRRILKGEYVRWLLVDVGRPTCAALLVTGIGSLLIPLEAARGLLLAELVMISGSILLVSSLVVPDIRVWLFHQLTIWRHWLPTRKNRPPSDSGSEQVDIVA
jgi:O-antigen/teichoic acid export membrane protein